MILYISTLTIVLCIVLFLFNAKINKTIIYLILFLLPLSLYAIYHHLLFFNDSALFLSLINVQTFPIFYLGPPMLYFYIRNTLKDNNKLTRKDFVHFIPALIGFIAVIPFIFSSFQYKLEIAQLFIDDPNSIKTVHTHWFYPNYVNVIIRPVQLFVYSILCLFIIWKYNKKTRDYSPKSQKKLINNWLISISSIALLIGTSYMGVTYIFFNSMEINRVEFSQLNVSLFAGISYTLMPILIFTFPEILYGIPRANKTHLKSESKKNKSSSKKPNTQVLIGTSPDFEDPFQETSQKIISYLHEKKPYLNPKFKIDDLVNDLQIPKHHIYYCFNNVLNEKFTTIRNNLRIEHSKTALLSDQLKLMTVEAIGMSSGFASKSNFFAIFKDATGLTPYEFVKKNSPENQ